MKVSTNVKIAMQCFENFGGENAPAPGCAPARAHSLESELSYAAKYFLKHNSYRTEFFFEAMDLYRTLDLNFNPMDSSFRE